MMGMMENILMNKMIYKELELINIIIKIIQTTYCTSYNNEMLMVTLQEMKKQVFMKIKIINQIMIIIVQSAKEKEILMIIANVIVMPVITIVI